MRRPGLNLLFLKTKSWARHAGGLRHGYAAELCYVMCASSTSVYTAARLCASWWVRRGEEPARVLNRRYTNSLRARGPIGSQLPTWQRANKGTLMAAPVCGAAVHASCVCRGGYGGVVMRAAPCPWGGRFQHTFGLRFVRRFFLPRANMLFSPGPHVNPRPAQLATSSVRIEGSVSRWATGSIDAGWPH